MKYEAGSMPRHTTGSAPGGNYELNKGASKLLIIIIVLLIISGGAYGYWYYKGKSSGPKYTTAEVQTGDLVRTVSATGTVKSSSELDLNFKVTGRLSEINVDVGDKVEVGQKLASLDVKDLLAKARQAEADLQVAQANYDKLKTGATREDIAVEEASVEKARVIYENALQTQKNTRKQKQQDIDEYKDTAITTMENKIVVAEGSLDIVYKTLTDDDAKEGLSVYDNRKLPIAWDSYDLANSAVAALSSLVSDAKQDGLLSQIKTALNTVLDKFDLVSKALNDTFDVLLFTVVGSDLTEAELAALKTNVKTEQANMATAVNSTQTAKQNLESAELALTVAIDTDQATIDSAKAAWEYAQAGLELKKAPARTEDLALHQAKIKQAQAALDLSRNQLGDNILYAPIDGIITASNYEVGEQIASTAASVADPVFALLGKGDFEIEVDISESDIAKISLDQEVLVTLDAFTSDDVFKGRVTHIDPAETVIQDVVYYKVKVMFDSKNKQVKSGMSADVDILTAKKVNVLVVPQRAVSESNGTKTVKVLKGSQVEERPVQIGLRGDEGLIEVVSGLVEGEEVVTFIKESK